jgi:hypothetical protein
LANRLLSSHAELLLYAKHLFVAALMAAWSAPLMVDISGAVLTGCWGVSILVLRGDAGREEFLNGVVARLRTDSSNTWKACRFILSELDAAR